MTAQRVDVNIFDGLSLSRVVSIHAATALSATKMYPVGSFVAGSLISSTLNQSFDEHRAIAVQPFPIIRQTVSCKRQDFAGKPSNRNIRWNEETAIGNNELEIPFSFRCAPSNPGIARCHLPCGAGKLKASEKLAGQFLRLNKIIQVSAKRDAVAEVMPSFNKLFECGMQLSISSLNKTKRQRHELTGASCDGR